VNIRSTRLLPLFAVVGLALIGPALANAAPPANDAFAAAKVVAPAALPYSDAVAVDEAGTESGEPAACYGIPKSVWYRITPTASGVLKADLGASTFGERVVNVYRQNGSGLGGLSSVACLGPFGQSALTFPVTAGVTYYLQAGSYYPFTSGTLALTLNAVPPPANDSFAAAQPVNAIPYHTTIDTTGATVENGEPVPTCAGSSGSAWYAFTSPAAGSYTLSSTGYQTTMTAYTGNSLASLQQVACQNGTPLTFHADAGTTVYLRVSGGAFPGGSPGPIQLTLDATPPPVAQFFFFPNPPSAFDNVQFFDQTFDPVNAGIASETWEFGDGATSTVVGCCLSHRYGADGTYHARLTVVTRDGRTDDFTQDVVVKTHDVAIADVVVPDAVRVARTKTVTVGISNKRYPETVQVQLLKSVAGGGWQQVGVLTQYVPVTKGHRTVEFSFNYTATPDDAATGKITFQAVASIQGVLDSLPADNTYISLPVKVKP
jgi:hypothetical protein